MTVSKGRITAHLAAPNEQVPGNLVELINLNIRPPEQLTVEDVHIRSMYIVSDQVNSFGGRFPTEEHRQLAELLIDAPVLVGHRKDKLPVARNFHAVRTDKDGQPWVRSYFYWLRTADGAANLAENIDGGIYKECSVAFTFSLPECSICGKDIRLCRHQPLETYPQNGQQRHCHFNYRRIEKVLETSLVYRGAVPETSMSKALSPESDTQRQGLEASLGDLDRSRQYFIIPRYDAVEVLAEVKAGRMQFTSADGTAIGSRTGYDFQPVDFNPQQRVRGLLVGYRGKDRCPASQTRDFVERQAGPVSRLVLNILPHQGIPRITESGERTGLDVRLIPHRTGFGTEINQKALEIMTREGVEVWPAGESPAEAARVTYRPSTRRLYDRAAVSMTEDTEGRTLLCLRSKGNTTAQSFVLPWFDMQRLYSGGRFVARTAGEPSAPNSPPDRSPVKADLVSLDNFEDAVTFESRGNLEGRFVLRPIVLGGRRQYLFSRTEREVS